MRHRLHVVGLPHTHTTRAFHSCAYTEKVRKFCRMMVERGHEVFLYSGELNEAPCTEHVALVHEDARLVAAGDGHYTSASFDASLPHWKLFNRRAVQKISQRIKPGDFVCLIAGVSQRTIADAFPENLTVEFGVGYGGTFARYRVFESYAWMHTVYGAQCGGNPHSADGRFYDRVIPGYIEPEQFPLGLQSGKYLLYVGRMTARKGLQVCRDVAEASGQTIIYAGPGEAEGFRSIGEVDPRKRGALMANAVALMAPTIYVEPFGNVAIEAMACGTPVISTDWGAFTETVEPGLTGFRCRTLKDFVAAVDLARGMDRARIRERAVSRFGIDAVGALYESYFDDLADLSGGGWYELGKDAPCQTKPSPDAS